MKENKVVTLAEYIINVTNTEAYRAGKLSGRKHMDVTSEVIDSVGGRNNLLKQAKFLENCNLNYYNLDPRMEEFLTTMGIQNTPEKLEEIKAENIIKSIFTYYEISLKDYFIESEDENKNIIYI